MKFANYNHQSCTKMCRSFIAKPENFFSAEIKKMAECHSWAEVMLSQSCVWASRASPAQKLQGLRVDYSKKFSRATFFVFWQTHLVDRFLSYLPVKQIWRKSAVCMYYILLF